MRSYIIKNLMIRYVDTTEVPLTPHSFIHFSFLLRYFLSESNYDALPSISSLPYLASNQPLASMPVGTPPLQKIKRNAPTIVSQKIKRQCSTRNNLPFR